MSSNLTSLLNLAKSVNKMFSELEYFAHTTVKDKDVQSHIRSEKNAFKDRTSFLQEYLAELADGDDDVQLRGAVKRGQDVLTPYLESVEAWLDSSMTTLEIIHDCRDESGKLKKEFKEGFMRNGLSG